MPDRIPSPAGFKIPHAEDARILAACCRAKGAFLLNALRGRRNDVPVSYSEEQQAICAVQLVAPMPGMFATALRHLLVVCTTTEVRTITHSISNC